MDMAEMVPTPLEEPTITGSDTKELLVAPGDPSELHGVTQALIHWSYCALRQRLCLSEHSLGLSEHSFA